MRRQLACCLQSDSSAGHPASTQDVTLIPLCFRSQVVLQCMPASVSTECICKLVHDINCMFSQNGTGASLPGVASADAMKLVACSTHQERSTWSGKCRGAPCHWAHSYTSICMWLYWQAGQLSAFLPVKHHQHAQWPSTWAYVVRTVCLLHLTGTPHHTWQSGP